MIGSTRNLRVYAYAAPADLRKGFDGLHGLVVRELGRDVLSGDCFLFVNRPRTRARVLLWDGTGLCLYSKRLEQGCFARLWPEAGASERSVELTMSELALFLEGSRVVGRMRLSPTEISRRALVHDGCV
jgi:transposase